MSKSHNNFTNPDQVQQQQLDSSEMEYFSDDESSFSEESEQDPSYTIELIKAQSNLCKLSINKNSNSRDFEERDVDDEGMISQKLSKEDLKNFEHVQKIIDCGQVEKLKVDQCKVYLRKHELRLTGKKDILIQRIKEHIEIMNGGGEKKYPPSSFVLNCKGDACLGDVVMFEQTVYEGYSIVSRSACGPPCGKRTIAGRIVNESYGAAKQQHTFTVEVLWSRGQKPLPPLYPLLIKGRNLYKLDTRRQKWVDEAERQRVLNEKHSRGTIARSNREARVQQKMAKMSLQGTSRVNSKNKENPCHQKVSKRATDQMSLLHSEKLASSVQQQGLPQSKVPSSRFHQEPRSHVSLDYRAQPHVEYNCGSHLLVSQPPSYQQKRPIIHYNREAYTYGKENLTTSSRGDYPISYTLQGPQRTTMTTANYKHSTGPLRRPAQRQQLCRYYPQGRCHYGNQCKFLHEPSRNYC